MRSVVVHRPFEAPHNATTICGRLSIPDAIIGRPTWAELERPGHDDVGVWQAVNRAKRSGGFFSNLILDFVDFLLDLVLDWIAGFVVVVGASSRPKRKGHWLIRPFRLSRFLVSRSRRCVCTRDRLRT
jgi:hypothetical protein